MLRTHLSRRATEENRNQTRGPLAGSLSDFESTTDRETLQLISQVRIDSPACEDSNAKLIEENARSGLSLISSTIEGPAEGGVDSSPPVLVEITDGDFDSDSFEDCEDPSIFSQDFIAGDPEQTKAEDNFSIDADAPCIQTSSKREEQIDQISETSSNRADLNPRRRRLPAIHRDVICNGCHRQPLTGTRYMCLYCERFNLCQKCEGNGHEHLMLRINFSNEECVYQNLREVYFDISMLDKPKRFRKKKSHGHHKVAQLPETIRPPRNKLRGR